MTLRLGSLFSGIGALDLGLERAGMQVRWQVENDPYCQRVLAKHWPDVPRYGDVTTLDFRVLEAVDVICGGFPCQDVSNAGPKDGLNGSRTGLWSSFADAVRDLRPRYVLVENVAALLVRGMGRVLGDLAALRYDAEWECIPASAVGAPHAGHGRDRVWIVANPNGVGLEGPGLPWRPQRELVAGTAGSGGGLARLPRTAPHHWEVEPDVGRVADGAPARVDRLRGLGNAVVPQVAEYVGRLIVEHAEAVDDVRVATS